MREMARTMKLSSNIAEFFYLLNVRRDIPCELLRTAFLDILAHRDPQVRDILMSGFLTGVMAKGPSVNEIATLIKAVFQLDGLSIGSAVRVRLPKGRMLIGAVGSGKKGFKTMNISTPSMIVAASVGGFFAKPGSGSTSSVTGSSDFMRAVGADISLERQKMIEVLMKTGLGFFPIEELIPRFDAVYGGRFYFPHVLSFGLAALVSPVRFDNVLYGLAHPDVELCIKVLQKLDIKNALVVTCTHDGIHYLDEIGIFGETTLIGMQNSKIGRLLRFRPTEDLGLPRFSPKSIAQGRGVEENVRFAVAVLQGKGQCPREDVVCINAGNLLYLGQLVENAKEGYHVAKRLVKTGRPYEKLAEFVEATHGDKRKLSAFT
jgi:anthranilate phosphoribosyltransferase